MVTTFVRKDWFYFSNASLVGNFAWSQILLVFLCITLFHANYSLCFNLPGAFLKVLLCKQQQNLSVHIKLFLETSVRFCDEKQTGSKPYLSLNHCKELRDERASSLMVLEGPVDFFIFIVNFNSSINKSTVFC